MQHRDMSKDGVMEEEGRWEGKVRRGMEKWREGGREEMREMDGDRWRKKIERLMDRMRERNVQSDGEKESK
jgi:hypothetical protein